ncbi:MAG TPA: aminotransferase class IV [Spirochaetia bacterium]|nr:aminotransferase class IV [Spirochaetia bacterium]
MDELVSLNGAFMPRQQALVPVGDRGFLYGYGLFETILVREGRPVLLSRHLRRLAASCRALELPPASSRGPLAALVREMIERNRVGEGALRLTWSAGQEGGGGNLVITARPLPYGPADYRRGFRASLAGTRRHEGSPLVGLKTLNYLENLLARQKARQEGLDEVLFLNTGGGLAEASASNIFLIKGDRLITPATGQGILPGIVRGLVLERAGAAGLKPEERRVRLAELVTADEIFLTNSLMGVMPLVDVAGQRVGGGCPGDLTTRLGGLVEESFRGTPEEGT